MEKIKTFYDRAKKVNKRVILNSVIGLLITVLTFVAIIYAMNVFGITVETIKSFAEKFGVWSAFILVVLMMLSVMSPLPDTPVAIAAMIIYGPVVGFLITYSGTVLGAVLNFLIVRKLGRKYFEKRFPNLVDYSNKIAGKYGFEVIVFLRIFPSVTFDIASYSAALTKVRFRIFLYASMLGALVPSTNYVLIGSGIASGNLYQIILTLLVSIVFLGVMRVSMKYFLKTRKIEILEENS